MGHIVQFRVKKPLMKYRPFWHGMSYYGDTLYLHVMQGMFSQLSIKHVDEILKRFIFEGVRIRRSDIFTGVAPFKSAK